MITYLLLSLAALILWNLILPPATE